MRSLPLKIPTSSLLYTLVANTQIGENGQLPQADHHSLPHGFGFAPSLPIPYGLLIRVRGRRRRGVGGVRDRCPESELQIKRRVLGQHY